MKLLVTIDYNTAWGEELVLCHGGKRYPMAYAGEGQWTLEVARFNPGKSSEYSYEVVCEGKTIRTEWRKHLLVLPEGAAPKTLVLNDKWNARPDDASFYSSAFTNAIFGRGSEKKVKQTKDANVVLSVLAANVRPNEVLALAGSSKALGNWKKVLPFDGTEYPQWNISLNVTDVFEYKLVIADKNTLEPIAWEDRENRWFTAVPQKDEVVVDGTIQACFHGRNWRGAGTAIPVFSLRTAEDFGVGEFYDLKKMVD